MRFDDDGRCVCALCGAPLDIPTEAFPQRVMDEENNVRILYVFGQEVHRCELGEPRYDSAPAANGSRRRSRHY